MERVFISKVDRRVRIIHETLITSSDTLIKLDRSRFEWVHKKAGIHLFSRYAVTRTDNTSISVLASSYQVENCTVHLVVIGDSWDVLLLMAPLLRFTFTEARTMKSVQKGLIKGAHVRPRIWVTWLKCPMAFAEYGVKEQLRLKSFIWVAKWYRHKLVQQMSDRTGLLLLDRETNTRPC